MPTAGTAKNKRREWWEIPNTIAIYIFAAGLFALLVLSTIDSTGVKIGSAHLIIMGLIAVLLLFRYFSEIKLAKILELKRTVEDVQIKQNEFRESTTEKLLEIKEEKTAPALKGEKILTDGTMPYEQKEALAVKLLEDPNYRWRNRRTILRKTHMTESEFEEFLSSHPEVILASHVDEYGNQMYAIKDRIENTP